MRRCMGNLECCEHKSFFAVQPENYGTLFERSDAFIGALDEPELKDAVISQNAELMVLAKSLQPSFEFSELLWAKSLCSSRAFSLPLVPGDDFEKALLQNYFPNGRVTALLPYVHFFNHNFYGQCDIPEVRDTSVVVRALVDIKQGEEVFINYGGFSNKELMLNYGFMVPSNPYDRIAYSVGGHKQPGRCDAKNIPNLTPEENQLINDYLVDRNRYS